jgi:hypothetical protein
MAGVEPDTPAILQMQPIGGLNGVGSMAGKPLQSAAESASSTAALDVVAEKAMTSRRKRGLPDECRCELARRDSYSRWSRMIVSVVTSDGSALSRFLDPSRRSMRTLNAALVPQPRMRR